MVRITYLIMVDSYSRRDNHVNRPTINSPPIMIIGQFLPWAVKVGNAAFRRAIAEAIPEKTIRQLVNIVNIMDTTANEVFEIKKTALNKGDEAMLAQIGEGKDIMSILCMCLSSLDPT